MQNQLSDLSAWVGIKKLRSSPWGPTKIKNAYLGNLYLRDIVTKQNIPKIEIMLSMAIHDKIETAVWTKAEWSPIDTSLDSSFITSFTNLNYLD